MLKLLKDKVKSNRMIYDMYYYIGSATLSFLSKFIKVNEKKILITSFGGKSYSDSPKYIYEGLLKTSKFKQHRIIWAFIEPENYTNKVDEAVAIDSFKFFYHALSSSIWISNSGMGRGLKFKNPKTFHLNTWHGIPIKKIGKDGGNVVSNSGLGSKKLNKTNLMLASSEFDKEIFSNALGINKNNIELCGLPRNDVLHNYSNDWEHDVKSKLGISNNSKVILYAPTYREYMKDKGKQIVIDFINQFEKEFSNGKKHFTLLVRSHYEVSSKIEIKNSNIIDVSNYEDINDLMIITDLMISDFSSIIFDYSILERPIFLYAPDFEEYTEKRGTYLNIKKLPFSFFYTVEEIINRIDNFDEIEEKVKSRNLKNKYIYGKGDSTVKSINALVKRLLI